MLQSLLVSEACPEIFAIKINIFKDCQKTTLDQIMILKTLQSPPSVSKTSSSYVSSSLTSSTSSSSSFSSSFSSCLLSSLSLSSSSKRQHRHHRVYHDNLSVKSLCCSSTASVIALSPMASLICHSDYHHLSAYTMTVTRNAQFFLSPINHRQWQQIRTNKNTLYGISNKVRVVTMMMQMIIKMQVILSLMMMMMMMMNQPQRSSFPQSDQPSQSSWHTL